MFHGTFIARFVGRTNRSFRSDGANRVQRRSSDSGSGRSGRCDLPPVPGGAIRRIFFFFWGGEGVSPIDNGQSRKRAMTFRFVFHKSVLYRRVKLKPVDTLDFYTPDDHLVGSAICWFLSNAVSPVYRAFAAFVKLITWRWLFPITRRVVGNSLEISRKFQKCNLCFRKR